MRKKKKRTKSFIHFTAQMKDKIKNRIQGNEKIEKQEQYSLVCRRGGEMDTGSALCCRLLRPCSYTHTLRNYSPNELHDNDRTSQCIATGTTLMI